MKVRLATKKDIPAIMVLEKEVWAAGQGATQEMILSRIETFPEGSWCLEKDHKILGYLCSEIFPESFLAQKRT